jgi:hypothetical protein
LSILVKTIVRPSGETARPNLTRSPSSASTLDLEDAKSKNRSCARSSGPRGSLPVSVQPETWVTDQTGYMGDTLVTGSGFFYRSSPRIMIGLWECGNLAFVARFPSPCGNRSLVSIGTAFPQPSSPLSSSRAIAAGRSTLAGWPLVALGASCAVV